MTHVLIIEPDATGHRMHYVRHLLAGAKDAGVKVTLGTTEKARGSDSFALALKEQLEGLDIQILPVKPKVRALGQLGSQLNLASSFKALVERIQPDVTFIPYGNYIDRVSAVYRNPIGKRPWALLTMRERFHHAAAGVSPASKSDPIKERMFMRQLASPFLVKSFTIDELLKPYVAKKSPKLAAKLVFCDEPIEMDKEVPKVQARASLGISPEQRVLLIYGNMDERKGLDSALNSVASLPADCALLVAGRQDEWARKLLSTNEASALKATKRLYSMDSYLDHQAEQACFAAADAVWLGYRGHYGSSGVLTQAAVCGLPIISCNEGLLGYRTREGKLGETVNVDDAAAVSTAVQACLSLEPSERELLKKQAAERRALHSPAAFAKLIYGELLGVTR